MMFTPLIEAAAAGDHAEVEKLLADGTDVNAADETNGWTWTALHEAACYGHADVVKILLEAGADSNLKGGIFDNTALHIAAVGGYSEIVSLLLKKGATVNTLNKIGSTALHYAVSNEKAHVVKILLEVGINFSLRDNSGETALDIARRLNNSDGINKDEIIALLVKVAAQQKKVKLVKAALSLFALAAVGGLVVSIGTPAGWGVMVTALSFAPWLAIAIPAMIAGVVLVGAIAYVGQRLIAARREATYRVLSHEDKEHLWDNSSTKPSDQNLQTVRGTATSYADPKATVTPSSSELSQDTPCSSQLTLEQ